MRNLHPQNSRLAFTLVELLVAMTVIAILVGMLMAGVIPAMRRAREAAIQVEMKQIEIAIEEFKNKYGFYPPSFESDATNGIRNAGDLLRYVNRLSPNHAESTGSGHASESRLEHWYEQVGRYLDQESSLVFWLSGICKNKQYPITGGLTGSPPIAAHAYGNDGIERDILFDFKQNQLYGDTTDEIVQSNKNPSDPDTLVTTNGSTQTAIPTALQATATSAGYILEYKQPYGPTDGDLYFKYRDSASYPIGAYTNGGVAINPQSFQLITFGMDGKSGNAGDVFSAGVGGDDNICNFADGRLEKYVNERKN